MPSTVSQIVEVLIKEEVLVRERTRLSLALDIPVGLRIQWEALFTMGAASPTAHFTKLLENWVGRSGPSATVGELSRTLRQQGFISTSESLQNLGEESSIIKTNEVTGTAGLIQRFCFGVTPPSPYFFGRDAEMKQLERLFLNRATQPVLVISGIGGQGKTELCRKFIKNLTNPDHHSSTPALIWLSGDKAANLTSSIIQLATALTIPTMAEGRPIPLNQLIIQASDKIASNSGSNGWCVVVDNLDEVYPEFHQTVAELIRRGAFILVTTRKTNVLSGEAVQIKLDMLSDRDATNLVNKLLNYQPGGQDARDLCKELGNHALALRHAVSYINMQQHEGQGSYAIRNYLADFARDRSLLNRQNFLDGYDHTIYLIVARTMQKIRDSHGLLVQGAAGLMDVLCLISPDGISLSCFRKFRNIVRPTDPVDLVQAFLLLKRYSLISYDAGATISIHRLVQKAAGCDSRRNITRGILGGTATNKCSHAELQQIIHIWEQSDAELVIECPDLAFQIFHRMTAVAMVMELKPFADKSHALLTKCLGHYHKSTLRMEQNVAAALKEMGDNEPALAMVRQVLDKKTRVFGPLHPEVLISSIDIPILLGRLHHYEEALNESKVLLEAQVRRFGNENEATMSTRDNMAAVLDCLGRWEESLHLYREVLDWRKKKYGTTDRSTLSTQHNIGAILCFHGQFEEARSELESLLRTSLNVLGPDHAHTLKSRCILGHTLASLGRMGEARTMTEAVLVTQEKVLGRYHPDTELTRRQMNKILAATTVNSK